MCDLHGLIVVGTTWVSYILENGGCVASWMVSRIQVRGVDDITKRTMCEPWLYVPHVMVYSPEKLEKFRKEWEKWDRDWEGSW